YNKTKEPRIIGIGREVQGKKKNGHIFPFRLAVSEVILNDRVVFAGIVHDLSEVKKAESEIVELNKKLEKKVNERTYELEKTVNKLLQTNSTLESEISERIAIENKLKLSEEELKESLNKERELNELKSRFVSMASHEFRTPLTSVLSSASLLGRYVEGLENKNVDKHLNRIKSSVATLTGILNDFLSLSKLEEGKVEVNQTELNIEELCHEVIDATKGLIKSDNQKIIHTVEGEPRKFKVDQRILKNILFNLISNAIKYSSDDIYCKVEYLENDFLISIKDKGIGIPLEDQKYLFTRFFRASNVINIQGTGLGLNIVKSYVELLEGDISFESSHENGTVFRIKLPYNN
ncbi:MAG: PAS domain S-box protein, partial [Saprospiraceae bacterium]|nr:PAS domain-containing sensor histidine kinase [Bacteroidia bacterium]NNL91002.1 PAS domain S-box protein [Saprospiraceae bacterium]